MHGHAVIVSTSGLFTPRYSPSCIPHYRVKIPGSPIVYSIYPHQSLYGARMTHITCRLDLSGVLSSLKESRDVVKKKQARSVGAQDRNDDLLRCMLGSTGAETKWTGIPFKARLDGPHVKCGKRSERGGCAKLPESLWGLRIQMHRSDTLKKDVSSPALATVLILLMYHRTPLPPNFLLVLTFSG
jgi:hypothetical protein